MKKTKAIVVGLFLTVFLILLTFFLVGSFKPKAAGILIETTPNAQVFIDGERMGKTPFELTREPGEVIIKLVPESTDIPLSIFETKLELVSGIKTVVKREFAETEEESAGIIISFEKTNKKETSAAIISIPDASQISIDGLVRGFTPFKTTNILPTDHEIIVTAPGYKEGKYLVKTVEGYKLTAVVKLSPDEESEEETEEEKEEVIEVEILDTPTGFLRVRSEPSTAGAEVARVEPGEKFFLLEEDRDSGWFKIEFEDEDESTASGWISDQYAKKVKAEEEN